MSDINLPDEPAAHMYPSELERFQSSEMAGTAFSIAVACLDERSVPLFTAEQLRAAVLADREARKAAEQQNFEEWFEAWRVSTWWPLRSDPRKECPAHWNTNPKRDMEIAWHARAAAPKGVKE